MSKFWRDRCATWIRQRHPTGLPQAQTAELAAAYFAGVYDATIAYIDSPLGVTPPVPIETVVAVKAIDPLPLPEPDSRRDPGDDPLARFDVVELPASF